MVRAFVLALTSRTISRRTAGVDRDKLLDRIRRLLRLAESPNVHEAATAAATAQELMARHRIEAASLEAPGAADGIVDFRDTPLESSKRLRPWKTQLADVVARANGCRIYLLERGKLSEIVVVGRPEDVELVRLLHAELVKRVECLTRQHGEGRDRQFCNGFRLGIVTTLGERMTLANREAAHGALEGGVSDAEQEPQAPMTRESLALGLARLDARDRAVDRFLEETLRLGRGKSRTLKADAEGYASGRIAGHTVPLEVSERADRSADPREQALRSRRRRA